jgi:hypothetical protein
VTAEGVGIALAVLVAEGALAADKKGFRAL